MSLPCEIFFAIVKYASSFHLVSISRGKFWTNPELMFD